MRVSRGRGRAGDAGVASGTPREHTELVQVSRGRGQGRRGRGRAGGQERQGCPRSSGEQAELVRVGRGLESRRSRGDQEGQGEGRRVVAWQEGWGEERRGKAAPGARESQQSLWRSAEAAGLGQEGQKDRRRDRQLPQELLEAHRAGTSEQRQGAGQ